MAERLADDEKKSEALKVREAFDRAKRERKGITQGKLAARFGCTQGLIQAWLRGSTRIPDHRMFELGHYLGFNPIEVRPSLQVYVDSAKLLLDGASSDERAQKIAALTKNFTEDDLSMVEEFTRMLKDRRQK